MIKKEKIIKKLLECETTKSEVLLDYKTFIEWLLCYTKFHGSMAFQNGIPLLLL